VKTLNQMLLDKFPGFPILSTEEYMRLKDGFGTTAYPLIFRETFTGRVERTQFEETQRLIAEHFSFE